MKKNYLKRVAAVSLMTVFFAMATGCGDQAKASNNKWGLEEFNFVLIPGEDTEKSVQLRDEMAQDLSKEIGVPVNIYRASDYNAAVEAMRTGSAQLALLGPFSYVTAVERSGAECVCVSATNGEKGYKSYFISRSDSGIKSLEDLEGKTFAFADAASTSGNVVPCNEILNAFPEKGLTFDDLHADGKYFKSSTYSGSHANSLQAVVQGNVDAAAVSSNTYDNQIEKGNVQEGELTVFYESPTIPGSPIAIKDDLPQELKDKVKEFLLNYDDEEYFGGPNIRYVEVEDSEYDYIRELQKKYNLSD